jgi:energy-coupling factor transport system substrate-specific component
MAKTNTAEEKRKRTWSTRDLLITIVVGMAFGVILIPVTNLYAGLRGLGLFVQTAVGSLYFVPVAFAAYVMRKRGAILLVSFISGVILLATPYGFYALLIEALTGIIGEIVFWIITRYRNFSTPRFVGASGVVGLLEFWVILESLGSTHFEVSILLLGILVSVLAFAICSVLAKFLADSVTKTGVLANTALGESNADEV